MKHKIFLIITTLLLASCSAGFECPAPKGEGCKKIMEIDKY